MDQIKARPGVSIRLGRCGEHLARQVVFDLSDWAAELGPGAAALVAVRPGDSKVYPVEVEISGSGVIWTVRDVDTAAAGWGLVQLVYIVGNSVAKSTRWRTMVEDSLGQAPAEDDPAADWVAQVIRAAEQAKASAKQAVEAAEGVSDIGAQVQQVQQSVAEAKGHADRAAEVAKSIDDISQQVAQVAADAKQVAADKQAAAQAAVKTGQDRAAVEEAVGNLAPMAEQVTKDKQAAESAAAQAGGAAGRADQAAAQTQQDRQAVADDMAHWQTVVTHLEELGTGVQSDALQVGLDKTAAEKAKQGAEAARKGAEEAAKGVQDVSQQVQQVQTLATQVQGHAEQVSADKTAAETARQGAEAAQQAADQTAQQVEQKITEELTRAKESGEFKGENGLPGKPGLEGFYTSKNEYPAPTCVKYCTQPTSWIQGELNEVQGPEWKVPGSIIQLAIRCNDGNVYVSVQEVESPTRLIPKSYWISRKGNTDISLNITTAQVGQIIEVAEVDSSGKPVAWRAVAKPAESGGSSNGGFKRERLFDETLLSDVTQVNFPVDENVKNSVGFIDVQYTLEGAESQEADELMTAGFVWPGAYWPLYIVKDCKGAVPKKGDRRTNSSFSLLLGGTGDTAFAIGRYRINATPNQNGELNRQFIPSKILNICFETKGLFGKGSHFTVDFMKIADKSEVIK